MRRGTGRREPGRTGGGVREAVGERARSGISKGREAEEIEKISKHFTIEIEQRGENPYGRGGNGEKVREAGVSDPLVPLPPPKVKF